MDDTQRARLVELATFLETLPEDRTATIFDRPVTFDMSQGIQVQAGVGEDFDPPSCGTACCIAGTAVMMFRPDVATSFIAELREEYVEDYQQDEMFAPDGSYTRDAIECWPLNMQVGFYPSSYNEGVMGVAGGLLGLTEEQAMALFLPTEVPGGEHMQLRDYNDPLAAAAAIRRGLATGNFSWEV